MDRTTAPGSVSGAYVDDDEVLEIQGTLLIADDRNAIQEELMAVIENAGLTPSAGNLAQVWGALTKGAGSLVNADKLDGADKDTDGTLAGNSDNSVPTEKAVKSYIDNTRFMPVGTILMFDANNAGGGSGGASGAWVDNVTMPGWRACIAGNAAYGCPDLTDKFIMGKIVAGAGATGGANSVTLTEAQIPGHTHTGPSHTHTANHNHTASSNTTGAHTHTPRLNAYDWDTGAELHSKMGGAKQSTTVRNADITTTSNGDHSHTITVNTQSVTTSSSGTGNTGSAGGGTSHENRPAFYSVIFIRKCA